MNLDTIKQISIKRFEKCSKLGKGSFGYVWKIKEKGTEDFYAAKIIECNNTEEEESFNRNIEQEVRIMMYCQNPTIIGFLGYSKVDLNNENNVTIIMELAENGSLSKVLKKIQQSSCPNGYDDTSRQIILVGIARGMKYLHDRNIIHRDLKSDNILLDKKFHPLISDFGLSKFIENGHSHSQSNNVGTLTYMAPEMIRGEKYGKEVDVYSFGILMFEIATDSIPFPDLEKKIIPPYIFQRKISEEFYRPTFNAPINENLKKMIEKCWSDEPAKRPTFDEIFDQLSGETAKDYFLENVDEEEFQMYVEDIVETFDPSEILVDKISKYKNEINDLKLREENMKNEIKKLKMLQKNHEKLKKDYEKLKEDHNKLKEDHNKLKEDHNKLKEDYNKLKEDHNKLEKQSLKTELLIKSLNNQTSKKEMAPESNIQITPEIKHILILMDNKVTTETTEQEILNTPWFHLEKLINPLNEETSQPETSFMNAPYLLVEFLIESFAIDQPKQFQHIEHKIFENKQLMNLKMPFLMPLTFQTEGDENIQIGFFSLSDFSSEDMKELCSTVLTTFSQRKMFVISIMDVDKTFPFSDLEKLSNELDFIYFEQTFSNIIEKYSILFTNECKKF